jgi:hypothetical protein
MTAREIAQALIADKAPQATRKQAIDSGCPSNIRPCMLVLNRINAHLKLVL